VISSHAPHNKALRALTMKEASHMDDRLRLAVELNEEVLRRLERTFADLEKGEDEWRPLPESNNIALIVRHLSIEAQWHLDCLERGAPMVFQPSPELQRQIDAVPNDFTANLADLTQRVHRFLELLRAATAEQLQARSSSAYGHRAATRPHLLGYHQAIHLYGHLGQISMIRNLYQKTRGRPSRFFPENPTYPRSEAG
jgi:hypothetical protein